MLYCATFYQFYLSASPANIIIKGGLTANTSYFVRIADKFGNRYTQTIVSDGTGNITIPVNGTYPKGFFTAYSGIFEIEVSLTVAAWVAVPFTFNAKQYDCIQVEFTVNNASINTIQ